MDDKKKRFIVPETEIIDFSDKDIITGSGEDLFNDDGTDNQETW